MTDEVTASDVRLFVAFHERDELLTLSDTLATQKEREMKAALVDMLQAIELHAPQIAIVALENHQNVLERLRKQ
jgi:hypothetical protein